MRAINYSTARRELAQTMDAVQEDHEPVIITKKGDCSVVMISLQDYSSLVETDYLLSTPANAGHLMRSIAEHRSGKTVKVPQDQLKEILYGN